MHWLYILGGAVLTGFVTFCVAGAWLVIKCDGGLTFPNPEERLP